MVTLFEAFIRLDRFQAWIWASTQKLFIWYKTRKQCTISILNELNEPENNIFNVFEKKKKLVYMDRLTIFKLLIRTAKY